MLTISRIRAVILTAAALAALAAPAAADPAVWVLADEDSEIYLFGTVHILPPSLEWRSGEIRQAFDAADTVWFEAPVLDPAGQADMARLVFELGMNPPGRPLSAQISDEARSALAEIAPLVGLPPSALEPLRPWIAAVTLTAAYVQSQGYHPDSGVESVLWPIADAAGKDVAYFETVEEQVRFFADLPPPVEIAYFEQTVLEFEEDSNQLGRLVAAWASGDLGTLDELMNGELRNAAPELYQVLLVERNEAWVTQIRDILAGSGTHFIALGAGHFVGPQGVVSLLRSGGIEVAGP